MEGEEVEEKEYEAEALFGHTATWKGKVGTGLHLQCMSLFGIVDIDVCLLRFLNDAFQTSVVVRWRGLHTQVDWA